jgi:hypothetical protein
MGILIAGGGVMTAVMVVISCELEWIVIFDENGERADDAKTYGYGFLAREIIPGEQASFQNCIMYTDEEMPIVFDGWIYSGRFVTFISGFMGLVGLCIMIASACVAFSPNMFEHWLFWNFIIASFFAAFGFLLFGSQFCSDNGCRLGPGGLQILSLWFMWLTAANTVKSVPRPKPPASADEPDGDDLWYENEDDKYDDTPKKPPRYADDDGGSDYDEEPPYGYEDAYGNPPGTQYDDYGNPLDSYRNPLETQYDEDGLPYDYDGNPLTGPGYYTMKGLPVPGDERTGVMDEFGEEEAERDMAIPSDSSYSSTPSAPVFDPSKEDEGYLGVGYDDDQGQQRGQEDTSEPVFDSSRDDGNVGVGYEQEQPAGPPYAEEPSGGGGLFDMLGDDEVQQAPPPPQQQAPAPAPAAGGGSVFDMLDDDDDDKDIPAIV